MLEHAGDLNQAVLKCEALFNRFSNNPEMLNRLAREYQGGAESSDIAVTMMKAAPGIEGIQDMFERIYTREEGIDKTIDFWRMISAKHPTIYLLQERLAAALHQKGDLGKEIAVRYDLVEKHPSSPKLQYELNQAYKKQNNREEAVAGWTRLVELYPYVNELQDRLDEWAKGQAVE